MHFVADIFLPGASIYEGWLAWRSLYEALNQVARFKWVLFRAEHGLLAHILTVIEGLD